LLRLLRLDDNPSAIITLADGDRPKGIHHYYGCKRTPKRIRNLSDKIDRIVGTDLWIGDDRLIGRAFGRRVWCANDE
jgi:hypothetical protein